jgi:hypothetical protein
MFSTKPTTHRLEPTRLTTQCHGLTCVYSSSLLRYNFWSLANELNGSILFFSSELRVFLFHLPGSVCEFRASIGGGIHSVHAHGVGEALFVGHLQMFDYKGVLSPLRFRLCDVYRHTRNTTTVRYTKWISKAASAYSVDELLVRHSRRYTEWVGFLAE